MKTTLDVQDGLLAREKRYAKEAARPLHKVVEDGLRKVLAVLLPRRMSASKPKPSRRSSATGMPAPGHDRGNAPPRRSS